MTDPRPCPFCGGPATADPARWAGERSIVECRPCRLAMGGAAGEPLSSVVERWNTRPAQADKGAAE